MCRKDALCIRIDSFSAAYDKKGLLLFTWIRIEPKIEWSVFGSAPLSQDFVASNTSAACARNFQTGADSKLWSQIILEAICGLVISSPSCAKEIIKPAFRIVGLRKHMTCTATCQDLENRVRKSFSMACEGPSTRKPSVSSNIHTRNLRCIYPVDACLFIFEMIFRSTQKLPIYTKHTIYAHFHLLLQFVAPEIDFWKRWIFLVVFSCRHITVVGSSIVYVADLR